jgi:hypothetical protein
MIETPATIAHGYDIRGEVSGETGAVSLPERSDVVIKGSRAFKRTAPVD